MKKGIKAEDAEMLEEYDFKDGVRGKYISRFPVGANAVVLSPDVAEVFPDSQAVNEALRTLIRISRQNFPPPNNPDNQSQAPTGQAEN